MTNIHYVSSSTEVAALYGQIDLIEHFLTKYEVRRDEHSWFKSVDYCAVRHGNWDKFIRLINLLRDGNPHDFSIAPYPILDFAINVDPLDCAIEYGNLYFAQRLTNPGTLRRFAYSDTNDFIKNAEESKNYALLRFIKEQIEDGKKHQELFLLNQALAEAAEREEEFQERDESDETYGNALKHRGIKRTP